MQWVTGAQKYGRDTLFEYLSLHGHVYFSNRFAGALGSKIWNATDGAARLIETIVWSYLNMFIGFIGSLFLIYLASPVLAGVYVFWIIILVAVSYFFALRNRAFSEARARERSKLSGTIVDIITNISAVHYYARLKDEMRRVKEGTDSLRIASVWAWLGSELLLIVGNIIMGLFVISMLFGAYTYWSTEAISTGDFVMILTLMVGLVGWFSHIGKSINSFASEYGSVQEGLGDILPPHDITDFPKAKNLLLERGDITCKSMGFSYGTRQIFKNLNLLIPGGQRVGIIGPSGSGKTTLVSLLLRQHDVHEGEIQIDGQNIRKVTQDSLHTAIATVPQEPLLFHRSIRENIMYGNPHATEEAVYEAARRAQAHDFINELPDGYDTLVGERGVKLSGGQRQRVAIARAILKNAPILILDEATSALDSESENAIQGALEELMKDKTVIAIAHRLSTIKAMDRIIVLDGGAIIEDGTHDELVAAGGMYANLWEHQAGGFLMDE